MIRWAALASPLDAPKVGRADRLFALLAAVVYFCLLCYVYVDPLRVWNYLGFLLGSYGAFDIVCCFYFSLLPVALMPTTIKRFSCFINWCIYFFVYVPAMLYPVLQGLRPNVLTLATSNFVGFLVIIGLAALKMRLIPVQLSARAWLVLFIVGYVNLIIYSLSVFGGTLSLSDITDVYGQRSFAGELVEGTLAGYATGILSASFNRYP